MSYNIEHMFSLIKGMAMGLDWKDTTNALYIARKAHDGQMRKDGVTPYFAHPLTVASYLITADVRSDTAVAAALLHDYLEDCEVNWEKFNELSPETREVIQLLTFDKSYPNKEQAKEMYYNNISHNVFASLVKICDRCHNVSTMAGVFTPSKIAEYVEETRRYVLPLIRSTKNEWPEYSNILFLMKDHIESVLRAVEITRSGILDGVQQS